MTNQNPTSTVTTEPELSGVAPDQTGYLYLSPDALYSIKSLREFKREWADHLYAEIDRIVYYLINRTVECDHPVPPFYIERMQTLRAIRGIIDDLGKTGQDD